MNNVRYTYVLLLVLIGGFYSSCKVQENKVKVKINHRSTKFLVNELMEKEFKFNTLSGKASVSFDNGKKTGFKAHLRIQKDSAIWISVTPLSGIEMARVLITKDTVKLMNRNDGEYFIGDFEYLNQLFGADIDYQMLEALLVGNSLDFEQNEKIRSSIDRKKDTYYLSTEKKRKVRKEIKKDRNRIKEQTQVLWIDPITYKITELLLSSPESNQALNCVFSNYEKINTDREQLFPHSLYFKVEAKTPSIIEVSYSKIAVGKELSFPFNIPEKYEQIKK